MATATVTGLEQDSQENPLAGVVVTAVLYPPQSSPIYGPDGAVIEQIPVPATTNSSGAWSLTLERTDTLSPSGLVYLVTRQNGGVTLPPVSITVPAGGGVFQDLWTSTPGPVPPGTGPAGPPGSFAWEGPWVSTTEYLPDDLVTYGGTVYLCITANLDILPTNPAYWVGLGTGSGGSGTGLPTLTADVALTTSGVLAVNTAYQGNATGGAVVGTLPTSVTGDLIQVEKRDTSTNAVTVSGSIWGGSTTIPLLLKGQSVLLFGFAGSWWPLAGRLELGALDTRYDLYGTVSGITIAAAAASIASQLANADGRTASATVLAGEETVFTGSTASQTLTLPATPQASTENTVLNLASVSVTLAPGGSDTINNFGTAGNIVIAPGEMVQVLYLGTTWQALNVGLSARAVLAYVAANYLALASLTTAPVIWQGTAAPTVTSSQVAGDLFWDSTHNNLYTPFTGTPTVGALWTASGSTAVSLGGLSNPMTTTGDIIYGGASGVPTRLAGATGVLVSTGAAAPSWNNYPDFGTVGANAAGGLVRFVGAVSGAPPASGTWVTGDFAEDTTIGAFWCCTSGGTPGTWQMVLARSFADAMYAPTSYPFENRSRYTVSNQITTAAVSGVLTLMAIALPGGFSVGHIVAAVGTTAAVTPAHFWMGLYNSARLQLATTADQGSAAIAAYTQYPLAIAEIASGAASAYVTPSAGLYYVGIMVAAATMPNWYSAGSVGINYAPVLFGASDTAQTTPPAFAHTATAITAGNANYPWVAVGP